MKPNSGPPFYRQIVMGLTLYFALSACSCGPDKTNPEFGNPTPQKPAIPYYFETSYSEPTDNPSTKEGVELGKQLFFEKQLSRDGTISCATCHKPELAFTDGLKVSKGIDNQLGKRNAPTLYNVGLFKKLFWDGRVSTLEEQSLHPILDSKEMGLSLDEAVARIKAIPKYSSLFGKSFGSVEVSSDRIAKALAQFERSLVSADSRYDRYLKGLYTPTVEEQLGIQLFFTHPNPFAPAPGLRGGNCGDCHLPGTLIGNQNGFDGFHNTGLNSEFSSSSDLGLEIQSGKLADRGRFKTPSLRNIELTAPYMHDGRFLTLEEVLNHYNDEEIFSHPNVDALIAAGTNQKNGSSLALTEQEKKAILAFLKMLTDSSSTRSFQP
ncbi:MAG TPA: cytochrome c peroxidase [Catalimonadaceae bacterium]|nr:cytochrome c peroxidase [Catalimonadaceae bacterium]